MTSPRCQLLDPIASGYFHCMSRCVRRAFLCGKDKFSGKSFEHRRAWVEERLLELAEIFAVGLYAYAVMSNHLHAVVYVDPAAALTWSPEEVADRWVRLFPVRDNGQVDPDGCRLRAQNIQGDPKRLAIYRQRLGSLSWFMRCLNEPIARRANREDGCTGRFWEGRFKCQALLDDAAVLACMTYVDLNPIRAGIASDLESSDHTAIKRRIETIDALAEDRTLRPIAGSVGESLLPLNLREYLQLTDWTGRRVRPGKRGAIAAESLPILARLGLRNNQWQAQVFGIESRYWRAVGAVDVLLEKAKTIGQYWLKGCGVRRQLLETRFV